MSRSLKPADGGSLVPTSPRSFGPISSPRFLLVYPPLQFGPLDIAKPDGSLGLAYLAAALRADGFMVEILDTAVGGNDARLGDTFFRAVPVSPTLHRIGMTDEAILAAVEAWDVIGITSIFTPQTTLALATIRLIKMAYPEKLVVVGGGNARSLCSRFMAAGADVVCLSEAERTICEIGRALRDGVTTFAAIAGIATRDSGGRVRCVPARSITVDLDELPIPSWEQLPNAKYWEINRPHGGYFPPGQQIRYASMMTSRGCPFRCTFCHISKETEGSLSGPLGNLRFKSFDRVLAEFEKLASLGVEYVFIEDDSLFAKKKRIVQILEALKRYRMRLADVNGVNIVHLYKRMPNGKLEVDSEFLDLLVSAGFENISLPFESACQRILDKYATTKWRTHELDTVALVKDCRRAGLHDVHGNYMLGYPDETREEANATIELAQRHMDAGLNYALFFAVVPYPGSRLYDIALAGGHIDEAFNPDELRWTQATMKNTIIPASELNDLRQRAWEELNRPDYVRYKQQATVCADGTPSDTRVTPFERSKVS